MSTAKQQKSRTVRETTAAWEYNDADGKIVSQEISLSYFSPTVGELKRQRIEAKKRFEDNGEIVWISEELFPMLHCINDLPAGIKHPSPITLEWLEDQDIRNLDSIRTAIDTDMTAGKSQLKK